jgi:hypothetical protein
VDLILTSIFRERLQIFDKIISAMFNISPSGIASDEFFVTICSPSLVNDFDHIDTL